ncbi:cobalamin biosynthesis protein CobQ [Candidatus Parcubacteria bacterium]|nr:MAG: cobalamin biosynthesis protein CobQ [Candidatus Parcubacteria bacterium]
MNKNYLPKAIRHSLTIGWLYPDLMSTYGDRGNIIVLQKRCEWRNIEVKILHLNPGFDHKLLATCNMLFMGGAQDKQQQIVAQDLKKEKVETLKKMVDDGVPGLYICGAYQLLGKYYKEADGTKILGLGIFDLYTENPGENHPRLIGNIIAELAGSTWQVADGKKTTSYAPQATRHIVGFENHGGRTYLGKNVKPFAKVIKGFGNNGEDGTEGAIYKNAIGTYLHGPILPKNPEIADYLIKKALEVKYKDEIGLEDLDDSLEQKAKEIIEKRYNVKV